MLILPDLLMLENQLVIWDSGGLHPLWQAPHLPQVLFLAVLLSAGWPYDLPFGMACEGEAKGWHGCKGCAGPCLRHNSAKPCLAMQASGMAWAPGYHEHMRA